MSEEKKKLIFVFNADTGGKWKGFKETLSKTFRPSTYECNLCAVTYGAFGMKKEWKKFVNNLDVPVESMGRDIFDIEFLHRDEFDQKYKISDAKYPSAYLEDTEGLRVFINQEEMNAVKDVEELKQLVNKKIQEFNL
jgi:hypothetical protein